MYLKSIFIFLWLYLASVFLNKVYSIHLKRHTSFFVNNIKRRYFIHKKNKGNNIIINITKGTKRGEKYAKFFYRKTNLYLFEQLKKKFMFFNSSEDEDEKYIKDVISNIKDLKKIKLLSGNKKEKSLKKEHVKTFLLHILFTKVNFRIINNISYVFKQMKCETNTISAVLNEISNKINIKRHAENFLTLHYFLLKDQSVGLLSMIHILDFFKNKHNILDALQNIKKQIYDECVNDLLRKKMERFRLVCEEKKKTFHLNEAIEKAEFVDKEDDLYLSYDEDLLDTFKRKKKDLKWRTKNEEANKEYNIFSLPSKFENEYEETERKRERINESNIDFTGDEDETLKELKKTYEELRNFKELLIEYIEKEQELFYFGEKKENKDTNEIGEKIMEQNKESNGIENTFINRRNDINRYTYVDLEKEKEREEQMKMRKKIDDFLEKYTKDTNKTLEDFKNHFIEQADINFKAFLNNLSESKLKGNHGNQKNIDDVTRSADTSYDSNYSENSNNEITNFHLQKLNESEQNIDWTDEQIFERLRIKLLYFLQKIEYLKYMYHFKIINEKYPLLKNEKTVLDLLQYGYKIVVSPNVDQTIFKNEQKKGNILSLGTSENKKNTWNKSPTLHTKKYYHFKCVHCHYYIFNESGKEATGKVLICPQCKV